MAYGKNGSMCWLAGAVRMLQKRVELLEAATNGAKCKDDDLHDFKQILSDGDELTASTVTFATVRNKDCDGANADPLDLRVYSKDSAEEWHSENLTMYNQVETVPFRNVSFAETVEMVEFDPAVHAILAPMIETVPVVENDAPAPTVAQQVHAVPAPVEEFDASVARATPSSLIDGSVVKVVHVPQVQVVEKTIEIPQLQTIEKIVDAPEILTLQCTSTTLQLHVPWWMDQSSRLCMFLRCKSWRSQSRSRSCILLGKSSIFQQSSLSTALKFLSVWTSSRPRQRSLWKQFFMRLTRIYPVLTLKKYATWHV